jgi:hypothetical protein
VLTATERTEFEARPVRSGAASSPWLIGYRAALSVAHSMAGDSAYSAKAGVTNWLDGVFQVQVLGTRPDGLVRIRNYADVGKTALPEVEDAIEPDLLFPYVPWTGVGRWNATPDRYLLIPQEPATRAPYPLDVMRTRWPRTLAYLNRFQEQLRLRSGYRRYFKPSDPFYAIYNVSDHTLSPVKVVWRTMGTAMQAATVGAASATAALPQKPTVFKNTVIFVPVQSVEEAHYLTAALNSTWANWFLRACNVRGGKSAFATNVLGTINVPAFTSRSPVARELSRLGELAAEEALEDDADRLLVTEVRIDEAAARLWDIGKRSQEAIAASLPPLG